jgi:hypothetical protein
MAWTTAQEWIAAMNTANYLRPGGLPVLPRIRRRQRQYQRIATRGQLSTVQEYPALSVNAMYAMAIAPGKLGFRSSRR